MKNMGERRRKIDKHTFDDVQQEKKRSSLLLSL